MEVAVILYGDSPDHLLQIGGFPRFVEFLQFIVRGFWETYLTIWGFSFHMPIRDLHIDLLEEIIDGGRSRQPSFLCGLLEQFVFLAPRCQQIGQIVVNELNCFLLVKVFCF